MGLGTDESWDLTPREFDALCKRLESRMDWQAALSAQTPWTIATALSGSKGDQPALEEFMLTRAAMAAKRRQESALARAFGVG